MIAVPCGALVAFRHFPTLVLSSTGVLFTITWPAGCDHWIVTHGIGVPGGTVNEQPLMIIVSVASSAKLPPALTFVLPGITAACPPWGHLIVQPESRICAPI